MTDTEREALCARIDELCTEVERLKKREQNLVTLLCNDCDIEASWDGVRKFWYIGLTESGCLMRDRVCKAEAENAKLREMVWRLLEMERIGATSSEWHEIHEAACELGIEVDE